MWQDLQFFQNFHSTHRLALYLQAQCKEFSHNSLAETLRLKLNADKVKLVLNNNYPNHLKTNCIGSSAKYK